MIVAAAPCSESTFNGLVMQTMHPSGERLERSLGSSLFCLI
jgi:hypothetical protein